jgi:hypothetical protein
MIDCSTWLVVATCLDIAFRGQPSPLARPQPHNSNVRYRSQISQVRFAHSTKAQKGNSNGFFITHIPSLFNNLHKPARLETRHL